MYLAVILDLYSRKVVGWSLAERMTAALVCNALDAAVHLRRPTPGSSSTATAARSTPATPFDVVSGATACVRA